MQHDTGVREQRANLHSLWFHENLSIFCAIQLSFVIYLAQIHETILKYTFYKYLNAGKIYCKDASRLQMHRNAIIKRKTHKPLIYYIRVLQPHSGQY
jgi:hypothetical protein